MRLTLKPASRSCAAMASPVFFCQSSSIVISSCSKSALSGFSHEFLRAFDVSVLLGQRIIFRVDRADVMVFADRSPSCVAEL